MKLAFLVLAHRAPAQLALLLSVLRHRQVRVYLHVDRRTRWTPFSRALLEADVGDVLVLRRRSTRWGGIELVDAALDGLATAAADGCGYFVLISGQDFPLRPVREIVGFAEEARTSSYVEHFALPSDHWRFGGRDRTDFYTYTVRGRRETCIPRGEDVSFSSLKGRVLNDVLRMRSAFKPPRRFPSYVRPFGGSQWWNLSREAVDHVLRFVDEQPDYRRYHEHTFLPDEVFFQSILLGTGFASCHNVVNDSLRFIDWSGEGLVPRTLGVDDAPAMVESGKLFARKFDPAVDGTVLVNLARRVTA